MRGHSFLAMNHFTQALEFRRKFQLRGLHPEARLTTFGPDFLGLQTQLKLIEEESSEFKEAVDYWIFESRASPDGDDRFAKDAKEHVLKELGDLIYVCFQMAAFLNVDIDTALDRIHASNMSKLGSDGNPIYNEYGKVLKGPNYKEPDLGDLV